MKSARFFVLMFCLTAGIVLSANFLVWHLWVADLRTSRYAGGDLARMGYLATVKMPRFYYNDLPQRHLDFSEYRGERIDVLTIGDSFSNPAGLGVNVYYQDHLATKQKLKVLNVNPSYRKKSPGIEPHIALIKLINSRVLDEIKPKYVLLESVERSTIIRLANKLDFNIMATEEDISYLKGHQEKIEEYKPRFFDFLTSANAKYLYNLICYGLKNHNSDETVYVAKLRQDFFTVVDGKLLAYYGDDVRSIKLANSDSVGQLNENLNTLAQMLAAKGIKLIFMPAVDKYNLYRDYLVDDRLPRSQFFEILRPLKKDYLFIDTKALLADELAKGEKDVFFADDTHWSAKAGNSIFSRFVLP